MTFKEFAAEVSEKIRQKFPDNEVIGEKRMDKLQGQSYNGLVIKMTGSDVCMTLNLDAAYKDFTNGTDPEMVFSKIFHSIENAEVPVSQKDLDDVKNYAVVKEGLIMQLIPVRGNEDLLSTLPHRIIKDMAVVYRYLFKREGRSATFLLNNELIRGYGITAEQLDRDAAETCMRDHPMSIRGLTSVLLGTAESETIPESIFIVTNGVGGSGASVIAYPGALKQIADRFGSGFLLIPSSVNEVLVIPDNRGVDTDRLNETIVNTNSSVVSPEERLGDHYYHYDRETDVLECADEYERRIGRKGAAVRKNTARTRRRRRNERND